MTVRVQLIFRHPSGYGWSEDYVSNRTVQELFGGLLQNLRDVRLGLLANDCTLVRARLSYGSYRNPETFIFSDPFTPNGAGPDAAAADFVRILSQTQSSVGYGRIYLGGVPQSWVVGDKLQVQDAGFVKAFGVFRIVLTNATGQWGLNSTNTGSVKQFYLMTSGTQAIPRGYIMQSPGYEFMTFPQLIYVKGSTIPGFNGVKTVIGVQDAGPPIKYVVGGATPVANQGTQDLVVFSLQNGVWSQFTDVQPIEITERRSGRPFGQRVGRQRNRIPLRR